MRGSIGTSLRSLKPTLVFVRLRFREQSLRLQQFARLVSRLEAIQSVQFRNGRAIDSSVRRQNVDYRQIVALPDFEIEFVVSRRYLERAGAEFRIDRFVANNRESSLDQAVAMLLCQSVSNSAYHLDEPQFPCQP